MKDLEKVVLDLDLDCVVHSHIVCSNWVENQVILFENEPGKLLLRSSDQSSTASSVRLCMYQELSILKSGLYILSKYKIDITCKICNDLSKDLSVHKQSFILWTAELEWEATEFEEEHL